MTSTIADRLKLLRERSGLSLSELSALTGVSRAHIHHIETGNTTNVGAHSLIRMAEALGVTTSYLLSGEGTQYAAEDQAMFEQYKQLSDTNRRKIRLIVDLFAGDNG